MWNSNTTIVKVKSYITTETKNYLAYSNTTIVKVKFMIWSFSDFTFTSIQIQRLLKLNYNFFFLLNIP